MMIKNLKNPIIQLVKTMEIMEKLEPNLKRKRLFFKELSQSLI
jgi:hypothetical protein